jgi:T-complex protein 1 subunit zeta
LGVVSYSDALLSIPKALAYNAGFDVQEVVINLQHQHERGKIAGLNVKTGEPLDAFSLGVYDNYGVKKQILTSGTIVASQLLLVDEIIQIHHIG